MYTKKLLDYQVIIIAFSLVCISFILQANIGLNLADEGYLWYGSIQTLIGEVPLRDFQSYDPGRYYWVASWFKIFGSSILSLRMSVAIFQFIGLVFGLSVIKRITNNWYLLILFGLLLLIWMGPRHKLFDVSLAMMTVYFGVFIQERPSLKRYFATGVFIGVAAFIGRNHGLYSFLSLFMIMIFTWYKVNRKKPLNQLLVCFMGIFIGYLPMIIMLIFIPNFFQSLIESILDMFRVGNTNLPLPIPWLWKYDFTHLNFTYLSFNLMVTIFPILIMLMIAWVFISKQKLENKFIIISSGFVGIMYMHHAFSRADISHLAQGIHPLLIGIITMPFVVTTTKQKRLTFILLLCISLISITLVRVQSPYVMKLESLPPYDLVEVTGDKLWVDKGTSQFINFANKINHEMIKPNEGLLVAPHSPTIYPLLGRKSPLKKTYLIFPDTEENQVEMIKQLDEKNVNWAILGDIPLDGREDLRFKNTHSLIYRYLMSEFEVVTLDGTPSNYQLLHRKK